MFDLFRSRQKAFRYILGGMLTLVALSMVITLIPGYGTSTANSATDNSVLAEVAGQKLTAQEVNQTVQQRVLGGRLPAEMVQVYVPQFIEQMIREDAARYEFQRLGLTVTDDEVLVGLQSQYQQFFQDGALTSKDLLEASLAQQGMTLQDAIDQMRKTLMLRKVQNMIHATAVVSPKEVDDELRKKNEKVKVDYIVFPAEKFRGDVKVTPEEARAYFDSHKAEYNLPEKRAFQALVADQEKVDASISVSDAQLRAAYSSNLDNFRMPERVKVRHILVKTTDKSDAEKKQLLAKAQGLLNQLKGGADFADLAKKNSDDPGSGQQGGDLGWVVRGQTVPEFEKAAFSLKPAELSGVITTEYGYHIIQVMEKEQAHVKPFEEVKAGLATDLKKETVADKMQTIGDQMHAALEKSPGSAAEIAKQLNIDLITVPASVSGEAIPTLGVSPEIDNALASMKKGDVSPVLVLPANRMAVVVLTDRIPSKPAEFSDVETKVRDRIVSDKAQVVASDRAKQAAEEIKAGKDMNTVAKSNKLEVTHSTEVGRADSVEGLGSASYVEEAFTKPVGTILGPLLVQGRNVIVKVVDKKEADPAMMAQQREAVLGQIKQRKAIAENELFMDSLLQRLTSEGKIKKYPDAQKRRMASFR